MRGICTFLPTSVQLYKHNCYDLYKRTAKIRVAYNECINKEMLTCWMCGITWGLMYGRFSSDCGFFLCFVLFLALLQSAIVQNSLVESHEMDKKFIPGDSC